MAKKKEYLVGFYYTEIGNTVIKAKSKQEAEKLLHKKLSYSGLEELEYECNARDFETEDATLI